PEELLDERLPRPEVVGDRGVVPMAGGGCDFPHGDGIDPSLGKQPLGRPDDRFTSAQRRAIIRHVTELYVDCLSESRRHPHIPPPLPANVRARSCYIAIRPDAFDRFVLQAVERSMECRSTDPSLPTGWATASRSCRFQWCRITV